MNKHWWSYYLCMVLVVNNNSITDLPVMPAPGEFISEPKCDRKFVVAFVTGKGGSQECGHVAVGGKRVRERGRASTPVWTGHVITRTPATFLV